MLAQSFLDDTNVLRHVGLVNTIKLLRFLVERFSHANHIASATADTAGKATRHLLSKLSLPVTAIFKLVELKHKHEAVAHILLELHLLIGEWSSVQNRSKSLDHNEAVIDLGPVNTENWHFLVRIPFLFSISFNVLDVVVLQDCSDLGARW